MEFFSDGAGKVSHDNLLLHLDSVEWKCFLFAKLLPAWGISVSDITNRPISRHRRVHNSGFPKFKALYRSLNMVSSTEIS